MHTGTLPHTRALSKTPFYSRYACVAARVLTHWCTRTATPHTPGPHSQPHTRGHSHWGQHSSPHTPGHSPWGFSPPLGLPEFLYPPSSARTRQQHSSPQPRAARPKSPGRDRLQGGILPPLVPEGGHPAARTGSQHARRALPHCPSLTLCVCVRLCVCVSNPVPTVQSLLYCFPRPCQLGHLPSCRTRLSHPI